MTSDQDPADHEPDALTVLTEEVRFYAAMHELSVRAWQGHLTAEAMLALLDVVDGPLDGPPGGGTR
ncbi:hypothetical protein O7627_04255 [Solwaraspora sp. WMMD1047]|uniref:hypothetical protein n=1 Tax=Solwaraspora sp. WMMD1047 TaxID=3016102 RepID=UPI002415C5ED|nr:hypothetical protein [Solwaraspora sp. WMMD1047]MDG4828516.1 hypothetical protein [Solwaraspora sp. WMMD1047]